MKKISVIVPVYNVENEVGKCIDSIINQTYSDIEIILVNDGSTDSSLKICQSYCDERICIINKINGGLSDARNAGLKVATGDYILFVDSDDYIEEDTCEKFIEILKDDEPDLVVGDYYIKNESTEILMQHSCLKNGKIYSRDEYLSITIKNNQLRMEAWLNLYNREFIEKYNFKFKKGIYHEDMQLIPNILLEAKTIMYVRNAFYHYIQRSGSIMHQNNETKRLNDTLDIYQQWINLQDKFGNKDTKKYFRSFIVKCYLKTCRTFPEAYSKSKLFSKKELIVYSIGIMNKMKAVFFYLSPPKGKSISGDRT